jgi:hypothetical protein
MQTLWTSSEAEQPAAGEAGNAATTENKDEAPKETTEAAPETEETKA